MKNNDIPIFDNNQMIQEQQLQQQQQIQITPQSQQRSVQQQKVERCYSKTLCIFGLMLQIFFLIMVFLHLRFYAVDILFYLFLRDKDILFSSIQLLIALILSFSVLFNFYFACTVKSNFESEPNKEKPQMIQDPSQMENYCEKCQSFKPRRAHHCSVCRKCILKMDHHCPWINNCVGLNNHRYFILMLTYLSLMLGFIDIFQVYIFYTNSDLVNNENVGKERNSSFVMGLLSYVLFFSIGIFALWSWYLCIIGKTVIEYMDNRFKKNIQLMNQQQQGKRKNNIVDNLEVIFGVRQFWKMFLPSRRQLLFDGINWTDENFQFEEQQMYTVIEIQQPHDQQESSLE